MTSKAQSPHRRAIEEASEDVFRRLIAKIRSDDRAVVVVKAPPGSGKTYLLSRLVHHLAKSKRIAVAAQTNAQADDICQRLIEAPWCVPCIRFVGSGRGSSVPTRGVTEIAHVRDLPAGRCVVVGTSAKWGFVENITPFDVLMVDEAWQMQWSDFVPLGRVASRFVLIGDPGQIPPVVAVDASRWETAKIPPHLPAPDIICSDPPLRKNIEPLQLQLPASRRLPSDAVSILQPFYDFSFGAWALPTDRAVLTSSKGTKPIDRALDFLCDGSVIGITVETTNDLPPSDTDDEIADLAVRAATRLLERGARVRYLDSGDRRKEREVLPEHIGISATHRAMNTLIEQRVGRTRGLGGVRVDTPERWQGLQRLITIAVHPLSGVLRPSAFDLETGRLCVMASRHQGGLIVVGRDHIGDTLDDLIVVADQPIGRPDIAGRGLERHLSFWNALRTANRIIHLD